MLPLLTGLGGGTSHPTTTPGPCRLWGSCSLPAFCLAYAVLFCFLNNNWDSLFLRNSIQVYSQLLLVYPANLATLWGGSCASVFFCFLGHGKAHRLYTKPVLLSLVKMTQSMFITSEQNSQSFSYATILCKSYFLCFRELSKLLACLT